MAVLQKRIEIKAFVEDFSKDRLKAHLMSAGKETILSVISMLPFGGVAKTAFRYLEKVVKGV